VCLCVCLCICVSIWWSLSWAWHKKSEQIETPFGVLTTAPRGPKESSDSLEMVCMWALPGEYNWNGATTRAVAISSAATYFICVHRSLREFLLVFEPIPSKKNHVINIVLRSIATANLIFFTDSACFTVWFRFRPLRSTVAAAYCYESISDLVFLSEQ